MCDRGEGLSRLVRLGGNNTKVKLRKLAGIGRSLWPGMKLVAPRHTNAVLVDALRVLLATDQRPHLGNARQMRGIQAADRAGPDDEDAFGHTRQTDYSKYMYVLSNY